MAVSKVVFAGQVLIDISDSNVSPETLAEGVIAYNEKGERVIGAMNTTPQIIATDDGNGNVTVSGLTVTNENGDLTIGG